AARAIGAKAILMATHPLNHSRIVGEEYARLGHRRTPESIRQLVAEARSADYVVSASQSTTDGLREHGIPGERIKQLPYGFDLDVSRFTARRTRGRTIRFLFVGKLSVHKGLHLLRDAFQAMDLPDATLTLIGRPVTSVERRIIEDWQDPRVRILPEVDDIA